MLLRLHHLLVVAVIALSLQASGAEGTVRRADTTAWVNRGQASYYWLTSPVGNTAQLLTLYCSACAANVTGDKDLPVVSLLRDTLGDTSLENDRVTYVWLLASSHRSIAQKTLSAIPFFYWHVGNGSQSIRAADMKPLMNLNAPQHAVLSEAGRSMLQWLALDPLTTPVRASSRMYHANELDYERLHLEETISYLRSSPIGVNNSSGPTALQLNTVLARLELRKKLLGGLFNARQALRFGEEAQFEDEQIRTRNWELLRQCAEKTGLYFEPVNLGGTVGQYAFLWFPLRSDPVATGSSLKPIWKLLSIKNPWADDRLKQWQGLKYDRVAEHSDRHEPSESDHVSLLPLGIYSLNYPAFPLLLVDFRDNHQIRRREILQRSVNEITAGVIGISHFTNWYYYAGAMLYNTVWSRRGNAVDQAARLDCYSQFRVQLALDRNLDTALREELQRRAATLSVNPLGASAAWEMERARGRLAQLQNGSGEDGPLVATLDKERRAELVAFGQSAGGGAMDSALHFSTLGIYTHRASKEDLSLSTLDVQRRTLYHLEFLESLVANGTQPEVAFDSSQIRASLVQLQDLVPTIQSPRVRERASVVLERLKTLSRDEGIQKDCSAALSGWRAPQSGPEHRQHSIGIASATRLSTGRNHSPDLLK